MKLFRSVCVLLAIPFAVTFSSCKDDDGDDVGYNIQPQGDLLTTYSNGVFVNTSSVLTDSVLSKTDYLFLGQYTDSHFGSTQAEFIAQMDARIGGISLPDTSVVSKSSSISGILNTLMTSLDSKYGDITEITNPSDLQLDSAFYYIGYEDEFIGDSLSIQAIDVYALDNEMTRFAKYYTNAKYSDYCKKQTLLGSLAYQVAGKRVIKVPIDMDYAQSLADVYTGKSDIKSQADFNSKFKGVYVSHSFNEGAVIKVSVAGVIVYYHYNADIHTTYDGRDTVVNTKSLSVNPLSTSFFLSSNKSVERINLISHPDVSALQSLVGGHDFTYSTSPAGLYTKVEIPFQQIRDSVMAKCDDSSKVAFNAVNLKLYTKSIDWSTKLDKDPSTYMLLINRDSIHDFFYSDEYPDYLNSFSAKWDSTCSCYNFDISTAVQAKLTKNQSGAYDHLLENLVVLPITVTSSDDSNYYYYQQLWLTSARFYGDESSTVDMRPRIDVVYTRRE